jgi:RNA polymerase sigma-70 factor (ECF subfamily)
MCRSKGPMAHSREQELNQRPAEEPADGQLVDRLQAGDLESLGVLYERHKTLVFRTALAVVQDPSVAEDILQESFLRLYRYAHRIDTTLPLEPWLYRMTVNLAYSWETRRRRRQIPLEGVIDYLVSPKNLSPEWRAELNQVRREVLEAVYSLTFNQRIVIVLHYLNSLSLKEIAYVLDCPVGTVKSRLHYGRENLLRRLEAGRRITPEMVYEFI